MTEEADNVPSADSTSYPNREDNNECFWWTAG